MVNFSKKLEQLLFYFLLFSIPFQARVILWQQEWYFNEWQSISVYVTDVLLVTLLFFWGFRNLLAGKFLISNYKFLNRSQLKNPNFYLFIFVLFSAISVRNSLSLTLGLYNFIKLIEFVLFYFYIKNYAAQKFGFSSSLIALITGGVFQAVIAIVQFLKQSGVGLRWLGESVLALHMTGIASFYNSAGERIIRAYGTTPHPNILASYLFLAIFAFYFVYLYYHIYHRGKIYHPKLNYFLLAGYALMLLGFFFTFARVVVFLWFAGFAIRSCLILSKKKFRSIFARGVNKIKLTKILVISAVIVVLFGAIYWPEVMSRIRISSGDEAVKMRVFYNKESLGSLNWFGVGPGNFVNWLMTEDSNLARGLYQPVHNIYLLIYSENGVFGIAAFVLFLIFLAKDFINKTRMDKLYHFSFFLVFLSFLFMGIFDHFLWTLQQGRFVFWLVLALISLGLTLDSKGDTMTKQTLQ